ncbi:hypothetical protein OAO18_07965, partial [Francisellaceae bacterium]|nr:hypothetical protein [Francisellaceae bacterium]
MKLNINRWLFLITSACAFNSWADNAVYIKIDEDCILSSSPLLADKYHFILKGDSEDRVKFNPK